MKYLGCISKLFGLKLAETGNKYLQRYCLHYGKLSFLEHIHIIFFNESRETIIVKYYLHIILFLKIYTVVVIFKMQINNYICDPF